MKIKQHLFLNMLFACIAMLQISPYAAAARVPGNGYKNPGTHDARAAFANNPEVDGACIPTLNNACVLYFTNITIGSINNSSGCDGGGYSDYTGMTTDMAIGVPESISISVANYGHYVSVFIDLNNNGSLNDPGEQVLSNLHIPAWNTGTATVTIPGDVPLGNHLMRVIGEYEGSGYANNPCFHQHGEAEDYTVNITCASTPIVFYADTDGDRYGDPSVSETTLCPSTGYVLDNTDCNDSDAGFHAVQNWYYDNDGDGYHSQAQTNCGPPAPTGWSLTTSGSDCNDADANIYSRATEIAANGVDENCNGSIDDCTPVVNNFCALYLTNVSIGSINNSSSCQGGYSNFTEQSTALTIGVPQSVSITGAGYDQYVSIFIDFNDNGTLNDPGEQVLKNLYVSTGSTQTSTITVPGIVTLGNHLMRVFSEYVGSGLANNPCFHQHGEAEDYTVTISCSTTPLDFYADADGDGYGNAAVTESATCPSPGFVSNNTDCNDSDANYHAVVNWYHDADGDGYNVGTVSSCSPPEPTGWTLTTTGGSDCNDANSAVHPGIAEIQGNSLDDNCNGVVNEACTPVIYGPCTMYLNNVTIGTINNNSACNGAYSDFTALSTEMDMESTQAISFSTANYDQYVSVYIDFDHDGILTDAGERVVNNFQVPAWNTGSTTFTLPANIVPGSYVMRVISTFFNEGPSNNPCGGTNYGEAEDYTAIINCATTPITYYADADGDGYGDPATTETALCPSPGYILDHTDCNDSDANYHINQNWYYDGDGDGYYGQVQSSCTPPAPTGWSLTTPGFDCDDTNATANPAGTDIPDNDIDDNCNGTVDDCIPLFYNNCVVIFTNVTIGSINNNSGCNGAYSNYTAMSTSVPAGSTVPVSFSINNHAYTSVYIDLNKNGILNDPGEQVLNNLFIPGYAAGSFNLPAVITPGNYLMRVICTYVGSGPSYNPCGGTDYGESEDYTLTISCPGDPVTYYADADGDGYGDPATTETALCPSPGYIVDNTDCNDGDANYHINQNWYYDGDGDGYYGTVQSACTPPAPTGWSLTTPGPDCNDTDAAINPLAAEIADNDIDDNCNGGVDDCTPVFGNNCIVIFTNVSIGSINNNTGCSGPYQNYTAMSTSALAGSTVPVSFSATNDVYISVYIDFNKNGILNDPGEQVLNNIFVHYVGSGSFNLPGVITPGNYQMRAICVLANGLSYNSCGGTEYGEAEDYTMTIACPGEPVTYYADTDGDGYGDPATTETALCPSPGYIADNTDCNDNDVLLHALQNWYSDVDGDGFYGSVQSSCGAPAPTGWSLTTSGIDCNDNDAGINANATEISGNGIDENCNGVADDCTPVLNNPCVLYMTNVTVGSINNNSGCQGGYSNYTGQSTELAMGVPQAISVSAAHYNQYVSVFIDFNDNGVLNDAGEQVLHNLFVPAWSTSTGNILIPGSATQGSHLMRVFSEHDGSGLANDPCFHQHGEAEDYTAIITCSPTPVNFYADADGDGYGDPAVTETTNCPSPGYVADNTDCNDSDTNYHVSANWYHDADGDGYNVGTVYSCGPPEPTGWTLNTSGGSDCNDSNSAVNPAVAEIQGNSIDDNCNGIVDEACIPAGGNCVLYISQVTIGSIDNASSCSNGYENYESMSTDMALGSTQTISVTGVNYPQYVSVFIDFNNNHILSDAGEQVVSNMYVEAFTTASTTFTVPTSAQVGNHVMRVIGEYIGNGLANNPCYHAQSEAEDYTANVLCSETALDWFADSDGDGYGNPAISSSDVCPPSGYVNNNVDCNDSNAAAHPGAQDIVNSGVDEDCNGILDDPCVPMIYYACVMYINNVTIGAINNSSGCSSYTDYTSLSTEMEMGGTESVSISGSTYNQFVSVYIDFNGNGIMNEAGERVVNNLFVPAESTGNTTFTLPLNAIPGSYRMRVISNFENEGGANNPCGQTNYGEAEDYTVIINCPSTPSTYYADSDGDGYGDPNNFETVLCPSPGYILDNTDCNDSNANIHLGATEVVGNGIDDNCDGYIDECTPTFQNPCVVFFSNVTIGTINNSTGCNGAYSDYTNLSTEVLPGSTQTISISNESYFQLISVYVDFNQNGNMQESGEMVVDNLMVLNGQTVSATFTMPETILPGNYRLRVISNFFGHEANYDPCGNTIFGEAEDYTLTVVCPDSPVTYYADTDGDGYGDPNSTTAVADCAPEGYVLNNDDCDDTNMAVNPGATEVLGNMIDDDCDNEIDELPYCIPYIIEPCSQNSISIYHLTMSSIDNASTCNSTGYENFKSQSVSAPAGQNISFAATLHFVGFNHSGFSAFIDYNLDGDFFDSGELVSVSSVYDGNDVASGTIPIPVTLQPGNYTIRFMTDLNEYSDPCYSVYGETEDYTLIVTCPVTPVTYYLDADADGYGDANTSISEAGCTPAGYVADGSDCDDSNAAYHAVLSWYHDADGDGYYGESVESCSPPAGDGWSHQSDGTDCDDTNAAYHYEYTWYFDGDGDAYYSESVNSCSPPAGDGWSTDTYGLDCDDTNAAYYDNTDWFYDGDADGYYGSFEYTCIPPAGDGWIAYTYGSDCDDNNPALNYTEYWYYDGDGDMYFGIQEFVCIAPTGEGWSTYTYGPDCDDTNADYYYNDNWFYDGDGDGYQGQVEYACTPPAGDGWSHYTDGPDCDDTDPMYYLTYYFYLDADADGYFGESEPACFLPAGDGWSENYGNGGGDCDDTNAAIHPGGEILGNGIDDNCDGVIDVLVYCIPEGYTDCFYAYIENVQLGAMNNSSGCSNGYADYTNLFVSANAGDAISYSVFSTDYAVLNIFIDYNQDGDFYDDGEMVVEDYYYQYGEPYTGTIGLPAGLADGSYRIRIKMDQGYYYNDACNYYIGESEDYTLHIGAVCADIDMDGYSDQACGGNDCNDNDAAVHPGAEEICNSGVDDDCDGAADDNDSSVTGQGTYYADNDSDGYGAGSAVVSCTQPANTTTNNADCNDNSSAINPGAQEICNSGVDDDCDGAADNNDSSVTGQGTYYADNDSDGYGAGSAILACTQPANTTTNNADCNDNSSAVNPAAQEICNSGVDDDCDGAADNNDSSVTGQSTYYADSDDDEYGTGSAILSCTQLANTSTNNTDCNDNNSAVSPGSVEICNGGLDDDCDGAADDNDSSVDDQQNYYIDSDADGYGAGSATLSCIQPVGTSLYNTDCNDGDNAINPGIQEVCNGGLDDDCDGVADNNDSSVSGQSTYYADNDGDGYGAGSAIPSCEQPANTSTNNTDCNDGNMNVNPAAQEVCNNGVDDDCDGLADSDDNSVTGENTFYADSDGDGFGAGSAILACTQPANTSLNNTDCNDSNAAVNPSAIEISNSIDDNCDNLIDNLPNCVCSKPTGTVTSNITYNSATITWDAVPCAIGYEYRYRNQISAGVWSAFSAWIPVTTTTANLTGLASNTNYRWSVRSICSSTTSVATSERVFKTCAANVYYADADGDGYGSSSSTSVTACTVPAGYVANATDCNDASAAIKPGATEICDGIDNNCDGIVDNLPTCPKPTGLAYSNLIMTSVTISWNALPCPANGYQYRIRSYSGGSWSVYGAWINVATNTVMITGLTPSTKYQYQVRTVCNGVNKFSSIATGQIFRTLGSGLISAGEVSDISEGVALEMMKSNYDVTVFPNPSAGKFTALITAEERDIPVTLFVTDGFGRLLEQRQLVLEKGANQQEVDLTNYPDAIYYIALRTERGVVHYPVVKSGISNR